MSLNDIILKELRKKIIVTFSVIYIVFLSVCDILDSEWVIRLIEDGTLKWKYSVIMSIIKSVTNVIGVIAIVFFGVKLDERAELT